MVCWYIRWEKGLVTFSSITDRMEKVIWLYGTRGRLIVMPNIIDMSI